MIEILGFAAEPLGAAHPAAPTTAGRDFEEVYGGPGPTYSDPMALLRAYRLDRTRTGEPRQPRGYVRSMEFVRHRSP